MGDNKLYLVWSNMDIHFDNSALWRKSYFVLSCFAFSRWDIFVWLKNMTIFNTQTQSPKIFLLFQAWQFHYWRSQDLVGGFGGRWEVGTNTFFLTLEGLSGKDTVRRVHFGMFPTSHFTPVYFRRRWGGRGQRRGHFQVEWLACWRQGLEEGRGLIPAK